MYKVIFIDDNHGMIIETFETFDEAVEYWNEYADTPSCTKGVLYDTEASEIVWEF